ncbi:hypothetical protein JMJ58_03235 [Haloterrigena salifodinae]|uniref:Apea-like HEPN domain-containing protein n=1 Tax=Haloterrigena salifodinae TaxID=2675099 RepID=A0A8T8E2W2_9EURY|nr:hypothetical protein [Haloterrigena salifodinae]QRV15927.1 hypothetical protein JMJ58_03235 [Haloterrigena salifodinae]
MDERFYDAYQRIWAPPGTDEVRVQMGQESAFRTNLYNAIRDFGLDRDHHRITNSGLYRKFHEGLIEIAETQGIDLTKDQLSVHFQTKKNEIFSNWLEAPPDTYTLVFPIMIRSKHFPDEVELCESKAEQIDNSQWEDHLTAAKNDDDSNFDSFLDELPNNYSDDPLERREWTYLKVEIEARDEFYALHRVSELVETRFAEINFFDQLWSAGMPQPGSSDRAPYEKWTRHQEPPFYLILQDGDFVRYRGMDFDYRRSIGLFHFSHANDIDEISDIPTFDYDADKGTYEGYIVSALLAYQDGITERSVRQSFFSFWRGIEILSNTSDYSNASDFDKMVDRGEFALTYHHDGDNSLRPELKRAVKEIEEKRHELVHDGLKTEIHQGHRNGAKLLLDGLLLLYIDKYGQWDIDDMGSFLKHGVEYQEKIQFVKTLLSDFS